MENVTEQGGGNERVNDAEESVEGKISMGREKSCSGINAMCNLFYCIMGMRKLLERIREG